MTMCDKHQGSYEWTGTNYECNQCEYERRVKVDAEKLTDENVLRVVEDFVSRKPLR